ncbi:MAG: hypothetical protein ACRYG7_39485 [Janthinobacterium lividum]
MQTLRPARRIPAARLARLQATAAAKAQARQDAAQQLLAPTPEFAAVPRLTALPGGLHWSGAGQVPAVGATVTVARQGQAEPATVAAYCHAAGFLGLIVEPQQPAKRRSRPAGPRANCVFGSQVAQVA